MQHMLNILTACNATATPLPQFPLFCSKQPKEMVEMLWLVLLLQLMLHTSSSLASANCQRTCGDVEIPYPFGILDAAAARGTDNECSLKRFGIACNTSTSPPKAYLGFGNIELLQIDLDEGLLKVNQWLAHDCYPMNRTIFRNHSFMDLTRTPYKLSDVRNKFVSVGCDTLAMIDDVDKRFTIGCYSNCNNVSDVINGTCSGIGCCEISMPKGLRGFNISLSSLNNHSNSVSFNPCSYAFLADESFRFNTSIFSSYIDLKFVPVTLEWAVGNISCEEALSGEDYACRSEHSVCINSTNGGGYRCNCLQGYRGNAYLQGGCQDIDECKAPEDNQCLPGHCMNTPGNYECKCPKGKWGDGRQNGSGCTSKSAMIQLILGIGSGVVFLVLSISWLYLIIRKRRLIKLREKFFERNGGSLLKQKVSSLGSASNSMRTFTIEELKKATNNYDDSNIIGKGGFGIVYKGILFDQTTVAIKRSKISDKNQIEQFINEVVVLSNIIHRNVVKLLGCCLETEVPLLVYEYEANGTLSQHLHSEDQTRYLSWDDRLRIASESAEALAYMHYSVSTPILHRDVKSSNILLDKNFTAKVSDFGTSRVSSNDQSCLTSLVRGTFGYLDPEYFQSGKFSDKSDVYSFGIVLLELLTGEKAVSRTKLSEWNGSLANYFISNMNENRFHEIVEARIVNEGNMEQLKAVAELAKRCLLLNGNERPTMREVAMILGSLRSTYNKHPWAKENDSTVEPLINESYFGCSTSGTFSQNNDSYSSIEPLNIMR